MEDDGVCGTKTDNERGNGAFRLLLSVTVVPPPSDREPEAVLSAAALHVGKRSASLVSRKLSVTDTASMSACAMGPTVEARSGRGAVASGAGTTVVVGATTVGGGTIIVASVATVASVVAVVATVATTSWVAEQGHHVLHLHKESSFAGGDGR
jgi:hypothetical protein